MREVISRGMRLTRQAGGCGSAHRTPRMVTEMSEMTSKDIEVERIIALILERVEQRRAAQGVSGGIARPLGAPPGPEPISQGPLLQPLTMVNRLQDPVPQGQIAPSGARWLSAKRVIRRLLSRCITDAFWRGRPRSMPAWPR
jgi:hypothetical protein